ncbi:hypothetical protein N7527_007568 [Penicillium freii]|nr:hypothetical protein N7527_007568 [Penicillium freii]
MPPPILPRKDTKTNPQDWQTALVGAVTAVIILVLIIGSVFLWRYLNKRDTRRDIPQGLLTHRWEEAEKQRKKVENISKKKWPPRLSVYVEWGDSVQVPEQARAQVSY